MYGTFLFGQQLGPEFQETDYASGNHQLGMFGANLLGDIYLDLEIEYVPPKPPEPSIIATPGRRSSGTRLKEESRILRIRILDEDGKRFIQEKLIDENELNNISIRIDENIEIECKSIKFLIKESGLESNKIQKLKVRVGKGTINEN